MPLKARDVARALTKKGFKEANRDHHFYYFWHDGRKTVIRTKISHAETDIHDRNCGSMARQIGLNRTEFNGFVECALTQDLYVEKLIKEKRLPDPNQPKTDQSKADQSKTTKPSPS